jgi:hypothetical protein
MFGVVMRREKQPSNWAMRSKSSEVVLSCSLKRSDPVSAVKADRQQHQQIGIEQNALGPISLDQLSRAHDKKRLIDRLQRADLH